MIRLLLLLLIFHFPFSIFHSATAQPNPQDPYLHSKYWELNRTPMQEKLRQLKPLPVSVVYYQQREERDLPAMGKVFEQIKEEGFNSLKQLQIKDPASTPAFEQKVFNLALDKGVSPWYYGMGGWEPLSPELLKKLKLPALTPATLRQIEESPAMVQHQTAMLRRRIANAPNVPPLPERLQMGEPGRGAPFLKTRLLPEFAAWLEKQYGTMPKLKEAWNMGWAGNGKFETFAEAAAMLEGKNLDEYGRGSGKMDWDIRRYRDALRFQCDVIVEDYDRAMDHYLKYEPNEPRRLGGHQLLENQAMNGWDMEASGKAAAKGGSYYASIHMAHHFFLADGEITRPAYLQARFVADNTKGGWPAIWEGTGGPTVFSGTHSYTVDSAMITRLMLSYVAAGIKGLGFWTYNSRGEGWEAGEYALTNLQGKPTGRSRAAGTIAKALDKHRIELWDALDEPSVGVFYSWENEAVLARLGLGGYPLATRAYPKDRAIEFAQMYSQARLGISRALMNQNVPFENVSERDLTAGLAHRYRIIYLPSMLALSAKTVAHLKAFAEQGGRVVAEMPLLMYDDYGRLNKWEKGSDAEQLFGFQIEDYYHTFNAPQSYGTEVLDGQYAAMRPTSAKVESSLTGGQPAFAENKIGRGTAAFFNFEAGRQCAKPGREALEQTLVQRLLGPIKPNFTAQGKALAFRRAAPTADHYFLLNEQPAAQKVTLQAQNQTYRNATDAITGQNLALKNGQIEVMVPANCGAWVRAEK